MRTLARSLICFLLFVGVAKADSGLGGLATEAIDARQQITAIQQQMKDAVGPRADRHRALSVGVFTLDNGPLEAAELEKLDRRIAQEEKRLAEMKEFGSDEASMERRRGMINELKLKRQAGIIRDADEKASLRAKLQGELDELTSTITEIQTPYTKQIEAIKSEVDPKNKAFTEALGKFFNAPESVMQGIQIAHLNATMNNAFAGLHWNGEDGKQVAWAHVRVRPLSDITENDRNRLLDDTYPIRASGDQNLWVWAGHFLVTFIPVHEDLKGEAKLQEVIHRFVDLKGLANIQAHPAEMMAEVAN